MFCNFIRKIIKFPEYRISEIIKITDKEIHLKLEPYKKKKFICSGCNNFHNIGYHSSYEIIARDLSIGEKIVFIHVVKRKFRCPIKNKICVELLPWLEKCSRVTTRFAVQIYRLTAITTNQEAGWYMGLNDEVVYRIDKGVLEAKAAELLLPVPAATNISVDEVSYLKYHKYLTNVIDADKHLVIWNEKGRKAEILDKYYEGIGEDNCQKIICVALDGARTYISSTSRYAVNALIVYDKFHVVQKLNKSVDAVRKKELQKARSEKNNELIESINCKQRFIFLKNRKNLSEKQAGYLDEICSRNIPIYKAMLLKESFLQIYNFHNPKEAKSHLEMWIRESFNSSLESFKDLANSFLDKSQYILNWFQKKISSAISEGFNNKIKRLKRMAYGYKDIDYFKLKIHQHCGLLNPRLAT